MKLSHLSIFFVTTLLTSCSVFQKVGDFAENTWQSIDEAGRRNVSPGVVADAGTTTSTNTAKDSSKTAKASKSASTEKSSKASSTAVKTESRRDKNAKASGGAPTRTTDFYQVEVVEKITNNNREEVAVKGPKVVDGKDVKEKLANSVADVPELPREQAVVTPETYVDRAIAQTTPMENDAPVVAAEQVLDQVIAPAPVNQEVAAEVETPSVETPSAVIREVETPSAVIREVAPATTSTPAIQEVAANTPTAEVEEPVATIVTVKPAELAALPTIFLAGGDYFRVRDVYTQTPGVKSVAPCYVNTYNTDSQPITTADGFALFAPAAYGEAPAGSAEAFAITFDPAQTSVAQLIEIFFKQIDPTAFNITIGADGVHRKGIYYTNKKHRDEINKAVAALAGNYRTDVQIEILPLSNLTPIVH